MFECMVLILATSALTLLLIATIHQVVRFSAAMKLRQRQHMSMTRLGWDLRDVVSTANKIEMIDPVSLQVFHDQSTKTYRIGDNEILIFENNSKEPKSQIPLGRQLRATWDEALMPEFAQLVITKSPEFESKQGANEPLPAVFHLIVGPHNPMASTEVRQ